MKGLFWNAVDDWPRFHRVSRRRSADGRERAGEIAPEALPACWLDTISASTNHTQMSTAAMAGCSGLSNVIFLGTGARSYMNRRIGCAWNHRAHH